MNASVNLSKNARHIHNDTRPESNNFFSKLFEIPVSSLLRECRSANFTIDSLPELESKQLSQKVMSGYKWKRRVTFSILFKFWRPFAFAFSIRTAAIFSDYASMLLLKYLIDSAEISSSLFTFVVISALILFFIQLRSILQGIHTYLVGENCSLLATVLNNVIIRKALYLTCENTTWSRVRIRKLLTTHSEAVTNSLVYVHHSCASLIELTIAIFWIWETLGTKTIIVVLIVSLIYLILNIADSFVYKWYMKEQVECRDNRVEFEKTVLNSMESIKLFSWEPPFIKKLKKLRSEEMFVFRKTSAINSFMHSLNVTSPFVITFVSFAVYGLQHNISELRFEDAFVLIAVFNYMRRPLNLIIPSLEVFNKGFHSATRINQFLVAKQTPKRNYMATANPSPENSIDIKIEHADFSWDGKNSNLQNVSLEVQKGEKHAFIGFPLCGKSSLLLSITGELEMMKGKIFVSRKISFAPSSSIIFSQTVKENILFGNDYNKTKYDKVITTCDLKKDLFGFPRCDATVLGEKGYTLTPTQKAQISLARCLYEDADIYALDKAFSMMDRLTSRKVFERVFGKNGYLADKTVILATNDIELTKTFSTVHVLKNGKIETSGQYTSLIGTSGIMDELLEQSQIDRIIDEKFFDEKPVKKTVMFDMDKISKKKKKKSMEAEVASVKNRSIYFFYFKCGSFVFSALYSFFIVCRFVFQSLAFFWLSFWLDPSWKEEKCENCPQYVFIQAMSFFAISAIISTMLSQAFFVLTNVESSKKIYQNIVNAFFNAPISFLTRNNTEWLLQILSTDLDIADAQFPFLIKYLLENSLHVFMVFAIVCVNVPVFAIFVFAFVIFVIGLLKFYLPAFHRISRLEEFSQEELLCFSTEYFDARLVVRIFGKSRQLLLGTSNKSDAVTRCRLSKFSALRWLSLRIEAFTNITVFSCFIISSICFKVGYIGNAQFALSVASILCLSELISTLIRVVCSLESLTPHIQKISNIRNYPREQVIDRETIRDSWPDNGRIDIQNLNIFADKDKHVIKDCSLIVEEREKLGIIGKAGSGKTQLVLTLVLMNSADSESRVYIDGLDIFEMSVKSLRSRITIIPQHPKIFRDTLRSNIDPCCQFADSDIWLAIEACQLKDFVNSLPCGLNQLVSSKSMNDEQQSQVNVCRALLKGGQIFIIDQSTKLMNEEIRAKVEEALLLSLKQSTTITVGNDFEDVKHCDRVVVIENGVIVTLDTPHALISKYGTLQKCLSSC